MADVELEKLGRRKWLQPCNLEFKNEDRIVPLDLPVPLQSPSVLNNLPDYRLKTDFFASLGLRNIPLQRREGKMSCFTNCILNDKQNYKILEFEKTWMKIIEERMRRNCESALTKYTIKAYKKHKTINKLKPNGLIEKKYTKRYSPDLTFKIPIVHQYGQSISVKNLEEMSSAAGFKENVITIENALIKVETRENIERIIQNRENDMFGFKIKEEIMCNDFSKVKSEVDTENTQNIAYNYVPVSLAPITTPMAMVLLEHSHPPNLMTNLQPLRNEVIIEEVKYEPKLESTFKWPGLEEVLTSYQIFHGGMYSEKHKSVN